ncbi:MAG: C-3',4' desaturase CrtD [Cyanobacteriota bacterium]|nr:C-3',4' desaturase CrtD [Cyanobacteriota bacterium]
MAEVVVVGAGIAGLTAAALLAAAGRDAWLLEAHNRPGGCAGTFRRGPWIFDVGATQVAGLEPGGIHQRLFDHFGVAPPVATPLDPACVVDLADGTAPVRLHRDPLLWQEERQRQFPGSERFWTLCGALHQANWSFAGRDPVLPPRSWWDLGQLLRALGPANLASGVLTTATVADLLQLSGCGSDRRLRCFLDLQLRLYSQEPCHRTAALYGATVLAMAQAPRGLWHLHGSMQSLSDALVMALGRHGGRLLLKHRLQHLRPPSRAGARWQLAVSRGQGPSMALEADDVVVTLPPQTLPDLMGEALPRSYRQRLAQLPDSSGALVLYGAVDRGDLPAEVPSHLQLAWEQPGSLFVSVSQEGDGRAPTGQATVIASAFTPSQPWLSLGEAAYQARKAEAMVAILAGLERLLGISPQRWRHAELATPRGWAGWTGRPRGMVGGLGQHPSRFGPFGLASRTPLPGLWLCGDSIHPGEGTAGVSVSALMACRQLLARHGQDLQLAAQAP